MAFTPEDGTGLTNANSYLALADCKAHHTDRGYTFTATDGEIQEALVRATDYIDKRFGRRFRGYRAKKTQALEWPRYDAYDDDGHALDGIPVALEKATAEYALLAIQLGRDLAPVPASDFGIVDPATGIVTNQSSGQVTGTMQKVGPIEDRKDFRSTASDTPMVSSGNLIQKIPEYPQADLWIEELLRSTNSRMLSRG